MTTRSLHKLLASCSLLERLCLRGLNAVTNTTCIVIGDAHPRLVTLDLGHCHSLDAFGMTFICEAVERRKPGSLLRDDGNAQSTRSPLKELRLSGLKRVSEWTLAAIAHAFPSLEVLDLSYASSLTDTCLERFVEWNADGHKESRLSSVSSETQGKRRREISVDDDLLPQYVELTSSQMGFDPVDRTTYKRRITRLRHLNLSHCSSLTDAACAHLAYAVPRLEFLELAGVGPALEDRGIVRLLQSTPYLRKLDLEDASRIGDDVLAALSPPPPPPLPLRNLSNDNTPTAPITIPGQIPRPHLSPAASSYSPRPVHTGEHLEHLIVSYAALLSPEALTRLIQSCPKLHKLEVDNTRLTDTGVRAFMDAQRARNETSSGKGKSAVSGEAGILVAIDCASVGRGLVDDLAAEGVTRPRAGWRGWDARTFGYADALDGDDVPGPWGQGLNECDNQRVTLKSFRSWQVVDKWTQERLKRQRSAAAADGSGSGSPSREGGRSGSRWFGRRSGANSGANTPRSMANEEDRGCTIM